MKNASSTHSSTHKTTTAASIARAIVKSNLVLLPLLAAGCATQRANIIAYELLPPPLPVERRVSLGTIKVVGGDTKPVFWFRRPTGFGATAGDGFKSGLVAGGHIANVVWKVQRSVFGEYGNHPFFLAGDVGLSMATSVALAPVGAVVNLPQAVPKGESRTFENMFARVEADGVIQESLRQRTCQMASQKAARVCGPTASNAASDETEEADTLLIIQVREVNVAALEGWGSPLMLVIKVNARLVRVRDGLELYRCPLEYRSKSERFTEWSAHDGAGFLRELDHACESLAAKIGRQMF